ncbi:uncharacterized protein LOC135317799 isoform X5 [Phalacrocorax carbo]|uniref:uncharacterized protein LOC135317799 isoform X5 n=1 Tax=Phalacrocorax carbo TaxID=9209 RepID=UPI003119306F
MVSWLQEFNQGTEVLRQQIKTLEEALEEEEMCQQQRKKEAEVPGTTLPELVEAQLDAHPALGQPAAGCRLSSGCCCPLRLLVRPRALPPPAVACAV